MVTTRPSSPITMPWPSRSVPSVWAERRSLGMVRLQADHGRQRVAPPAAADWIRRAGAPRRLPGRSGHDPRRSPNRSTLGPSVHLHVTLGRNALLKDRRLPRRLLYDAAWRPPPIRSKSPTIPYVRRRPIPAGAARRRVHGPSRRAERRAAAGGHPRGRPAAGAGRRRHRQDPRADHAASPIS